MSAVAPPVTSGARRWRAVGQRIGTEWQRRLWPVTLVIAGLALLAVLTNGSGRFVIDNHVELARRPGALLARQAHLWDSSAGLGRPNEESWVVAAVVFGLLRGLGASAALAERLFHAGLLTIAGAGMVALLRQFRPQRIGLAHVVAGLLFAFNPYTATSLVPSLLLVPYVLAPWFVLVFLRGVREETPWRWAAAFALLAFVAGTVDIPGLSYGLVPLVPAAVYVVQVERTASWGRVLAWVARAALLTIGVFLTGLVRLAAGAASLADRLGTTERPQYLNAPSSWTETWRGLGFWGAYFRDAAGLIKPNTARFYASTGFVLATFLAPCAALVALARSKWRPRLLFAAAALLAMVFMVGSYPAGDPTPYGRLLLRGYDRSLFLWGWRNSYKAGPGWGLGIAALAGLAASALATVLTSRGKAVAAVGGVAVFAAASFPFWTGQLYNESSLSASGVPSYWRAANRWLDEQGTDGRVLVLPGVTSVVYRWGRTGDDAIRTRRPVLMAESFPPETPQTADLLRSLDLTVREGTVGGSVAPIARRLGARYVVLQNDLVWEELDRPRPADFRLLREDRALARVASFGRPGQNVVDPDDKAFAALYEARLPPVEIYEVAAPDLAERVRRGPPLVVSGDGGAWPGLARSGRLDASGPVLYSASSTAAQIVDGLRGGGGIVVTDTNRRRLTVASATGDDSSFTLGPAQNLDRPANPLFDEPAAQSVATFRDATRISASTYGPLLAGPEPDLRPARAFDADPRTAWRVGGFGTGVGEWLRVDLRRPRPIAQMRLASSPLPDGGRYVASATIEFSDGPPVRVRLRNGVAGARFEPRTAEWFRVRIDALGGAGDGPVGFTDITVPGLDLLERIRMPEDVMVAAATRPTLGRLVKRAPVEFQFERSRTTDLRDEELGLQRRFRTFGTRGYRLSGALRTWPDTSDQVLAGLVGGTRPTFGSSRYGGVESWGGRAVDGDMSTSWNGVARPGQTLTSNFPAGPVQSAQVVVNVDEGHSRLTQLRATIGGLTTLHDVPSSECVEEQRCLVTIDVPVGTFQPGALVIEATKVETRPGVFGPKPIGIAEVVIGGVAPVQPELDRELTDCFSFLVTIDGADVPVRLDGTVDDVLELRPMAFEACASPIALAGGAHDFDSAATVLVDSARLATGEPGAARFRPVNATVDRVSPTSSRLRYDGRRGDVVLSGQSYDADWRAEADGRDLGSPLAVDTQSGWVLPDDASELVMRYAPQRAYRRTLGVSLVFVGLCLWLVGRAQRSRAAK